MTKYIVIWAWEHHGQQHVQTMTFDDDDRTARQLALALSALQDVFLFSKVRLFRTPDLEELTFEPASTSFKETRPIER